MDPGESLSRVPHQLTAAVLETTSIAWPIALLHLQFLFLLHLLLLPLLRLVTARLDIKNVLLRQLIRHVLEEPMDKTIGVLHNHAKVDSNVTLHPQPTTFTAIKKFML